MPVLAIVNVVGSSIARAADYVMYTYAGPEIAVASTQGLYGAAVRAVPVCPASGLRAGAADRGKTKYYTAQLLHAPEVIKSRLADCEQIKYLPAAM